MLERPDIRMYDGVFAYVSLHIVGKRKKKKKKKS